MRPSRFFCVLVLLSTSAAAEAQYRFPTDALRAHAHRSQQDDASDKSAYGPRLTSTSVGIGPAIDVTIQDGFAYAIGKRALHVLDLDKPSQPKRVGVLNGLGNVRQIVVDKGLAYITSREDGLFIVDVRTPAAPKLLQRFDTIEFATGVCKSGNVLFVACRTFGVELIDVTNPESPRHVSTVRTGEAQSVVEQNGFLYAGVWAKSEVVTVDVRNPWLPKIDSRVPLDGFGDGVDVHGKYLYAATGHHSRQRPHRKPGEPGFGHGHGLEVLDISDPARPKSVAGVKFPPFYDIHHDMWSVTYSNGHAFVADSLNGVFVLNVKDPLDPQFVGHWSPPKTRKHDSDYVGGLAPGDQHIYAATGRGDLYVLASPAARVANPNKAALKLPATRPTDKDVAYRSYRTSGQVYGVDFAGDNAVVACGTAGVHFVEISPKFKLLSRFETGKATDVHVAGDRVFVAEGSAGLGIYSHSDGKELRETGRYQIPGKTIRQVEVPGDARYAIVQVGIHEIQILDVSDANKPRKVLEDKHPGLLYGDQMMRGLIDNRYTCAFWHVSGLHWYDLKAEGGPRFTGDNFPGRIGSNNGLIALGDKTLAVTRGGYLLLDRDERRELSKVPLYKIGKSRRHLGKPTVDGERLYSVDRPSGMVTIVDIADPKSPKLLDEFELPGNPSRAVIHKGRLVIPAGHDGLLEFDRK